MKQFFSMVMRPFILLIIFLFLIYNDSIGQRVEQKGWVTELSSGKQSLSGVQVLFKDSPPEISNNDGLFKLSFNAKTYGDLIFSEKISKVGYELVNESELKHSTITKDSMIIVMCKSGLIAKMKAEYYDISISTFTKNHEKRLKEIRDLLRQNKITESGYKKELFELDEKLKKAKEYARQLADKYARTNFDDVSEIYKEAFGYFKNGEIENAIELLDKVQIVERLKSHVHDDQNIKAITNELIIAKAENEKGIKQDMEALELAAEMYNMKFDYEKADKMYYALWAMDSTNVKNTSEYTAFLVFNEKQTKAIEFFLKITRLDIDKEDIANAFGMIGILYNKMGDYPNATVYFEKGKDILHQLLVEFPENNDFVMSYSMSLTNLSDVFLLKGDLQAAIKLQEESLELIDKTLTQIEDAELSTMQKCNVHFKLYDSYGKVGNVKKSQYHYQQSLILMQDAFNMSPSTVGMDFLSMANQLQHEGKLLESIVYYKKYKEQCQQNLDNFNMPVAAMKNTFKSMLADAYGYLGTTYSVIGNTIESIEEIKSEHKNLKELQSDNPETMDYAKKLANVHKALSNVYNIMGDGKIAFYHLNEAYVYFKVLLKKSPDNFELSTDYAQCCNSLGDHINYNSPDPSESIQYYEEAIEILKRNDLKDKINQFAGSYLVAAYLGLAQVYWKKGNIQSGNDALIKAGELADELNKTFPDNDIIKQQLGNCKLMQGSFSYDYQYQLKCYRSAKDIFNELHAKSPVDLSHIASLSTSEYNISLSLFNQKKYRETLASAKRSYELRNDLVETDTISSLNKYLLGMSSGQVGQIFEKLFELDSAAHYYTCGLNLFLDILKLDPQNPSKKFDVANTYNVVGMVLYKLNNFEKASECFNLAYKMYLDVNLSFPNDNVKKQIEFTAMQIALLQNDFTSVISYFQNMILNLNQYPKDFAPEIADAYNSLSFFYRLNKEYDKSKEAAINSKRLDKVSKWSEINLLISQMLLNEPNNPEEQLKKVLNKTTTENPDKTYKEIASLGLLKMERAGINEEIIGKLKNIYLNI